MKISDVSIEVIEREIPDTGLDSDLGRFSGSVEQGVLRIFTDEGIEGFAGVSNYTSYSYDKYTAETLKHMIPALIGKNPLQRETLWKSLFSRVFPLSPGALAAVSYTHLTLPTNREV